MLKRSSNFLRLPIRKLYPDVSPGRHMLLRNAYYPIIHANTRPYVVSTTGDDISSSIDQISSHEFSKLADNYLETISDQFEVLSEDYPQIDCELNHGVMTLELPPNGSYVINKQPPNKQIWLSSPISGPQRFDLIEGKWTTLRDGSQLTETLEKEISEAIESKFSFEGVDQ